jgi:hypothetical protein
VSKTFDAIKAELEVAAEELRAATEPEGKQAILKEMRILLQQAESTIQKNMKPS